VLSIRTQPLDGDLGENLTLLTRNSLSTAAIAARLVSDFMRWAHHLKQGTVIAKKGAHTIGLKKWKEQGEVEFAFSSHDKVTEAATIPSLIHPKCKFAEFHGFLK
jgi:hypothetical protein